MIIPMLCVTIFVILVVWFLLPRVARLMIHTPTAISIFVCLSMVQLMSSYFATFRHQLTILSKTDALDEEKWLNMLGTFVKDWFRYESHFVHGRDSLVDILKERGLLSESDAVQPLIGKKS